MHISVQRSRRIGAVVAFLEPALWRVCWLTIGHTTCCTAQDEFSRFGTLDNVWVARKPPGFAFIQFADGRDADDACHKLDGAPTVI